MPSFKSKLKKEPIVLFAEISGPAGSRFVKMLLDTGATFSTIPNEAAVAIGCDPSLPKERVEFITASGIEYAPVVSLKSIKALGFENKDFDVVCHNLPPQSSVEGLLGLNFLTQFNVLLKFLEHTMEITQDEVGEEKVEFLKGFKSKSELTEEDSVKYGRMLKKRQWEKTKKKLA